jgi:twitching motility protein PilT
MAQIDRILRFMVEQKGSDLHVCVGSQPHIRVDGEMLKMNVPPLSREQVTGLIQEIIPQYNREQFERDWDTDFAYELEGLARFRVNAYTDRHGPGLVMRTIPSSIMTWQDLGLPECIRDLCILPKGLVIVTGPTGSGKTTTLAALIHECNQRRKDHIITIEDPIEFVHENINCLINQREVHVHTRGFAKALRAALREDPNIVLIGEMRDLETVQVALETAETGHLVFATLHTTTAATTVDRIIDQFPSEQQEQIRIMLSTNLRAIVAQTLLKKKGGGRIAIFEILLATSAVANLIREAKTFQIPSVIETGKNIGMIPLNDALVKIVDKGIVEPMEAYRKAVDKAGYTTKVLPTIVRLCKENKLKPLDALMVVSDRSQLIQAFVKAGMTPEHANKLKQLADQQATSVEYME